MSGIMNKLGLGHKDHSHDSTHHTAATNSQAANTATQARNVPVASTAANNNNVPVANAVASSAVNRNATATQQSQADLVNHTSTQSTNMTSRAGTGRDVGQATASDMAAHDHSLFTQQNRLSGNDAMTRSEEQLRVAKASVPTGVAALNKTVEVEHVEKAIPVQKERVVIEREPITCSNLPKAMSGQEIKPAHFETVLREDRVAATKETVPIERIRLAKQVETSVKSVGADLAKEHIDLTMDGLDNAKIDRTSRVASDKIDSTANVAATKPEALAFDVKTGLVTDNTRLQNRSSSVGKDNLV